MLFLGLIDIVHEFWSIFRCNSQYGAFKSYKFSELTSKPNWSNQPH